MAQRTVYKAYNAGIWAVVHGKALVAPGFGWIDSNALPERIAEFMAAGKEVAL